MMEVLDTHPIIEQVLGEHCQELGPDLPGYRNHVYRTLNYACRLCEIKGVVFDVDAAALTLAFHDLAIWTGPTFDYLEPSVRQMQTHLEAAGETDPGGRMAIAIESHHKVRPYRGEYEDFVEAIRRADLADLTLGLLRSGLPYSVAAELKRRFPNAGFHWMLTRRFARWWLSHPLRPLPMYRW